MTQEDRVLQEDSMTMAERDEYACWRCLGRGYLMGHDIDVPCPSCNYEGSFRSVRPVKKVKKTNAA